MNESSPLVPQGSMLEQKNQSRSKFKLAVFCVIGIHVAGLMALLLTQGCKREPAPSTGDVQPQGYIQDTNLPAADGTNYYAVTDTNTYVVPANLPPVDPAGVASATEHVIVKGDTFYDLAKKYHVTMQALKDANPTVNPSKLQLNQKIVIPAPTVAATTGAAPAPGVESAAAPAGGEIVHTVKSGETLTKIAEKYKVTVNGIRKANNLTSDRIVVNQKLKIPAATH